MPPIRPIALGRLWTPVAEAGGPRDFAVEGEDWFRQVIAPESKRLDELIEAPCLVLLGEPGMGKSVTLRTEADRLAEALPRDDMVHLTNLAAVSSDYGLDATFAHPVVTAWRDGRGTLHFFLDSFDESLGRYGGLTDRLLETLRGLPRERLRLRLACRSGDVPGHLAAQLSALWPPDPNAGEPGVRTLLLEPLSRSAVRVWATHKGIDGAAFLDEVDRRNARSFAARPATLGPLVDQFRTGRFPASEVDLFRAACLALCREVNPARGREPELPEEQRLLIAERVAILGTLAAKDRIWIGDSAAAPGDALPIADLVGGREEADGHTVDADRAALRETLGCGLFAAQDLGLVRWSHQVYREFLAANYFARRLTNPAKGVQFLEADPEPGATKRRIAPQLIEPAAWLAAMDDGVAEWIAKHDPGVLLRAHHRIPLALRPGLISWWLAEKAEGRDVGARMWGDHVKENLDHPGLAEQLRATLENGDAPTGARELAADLALGAGKRELSAALAATVVDDRAAMALRWRAARALAGVGSAVDRATVRPVLEQVPGDDGDEHRLRAHVLAAAWRSALSTSEALDYLGRFEHYPGDEYATAFGYRFVGALGRDDLVETLEWIASRADAPDGGLEQLVGQALEEGAARCADERIADAFARAVAERFRHKGYVADYHEDDVWEKLRRLDTAARILVADRIVAHVAADEEAAWSALPRVLRLDLPHHAILDRARDEAEPIGSFWTRLLWRDGRFSQPSHLDELRAVAAELPPESPARRRLGELAERIAARPTGPQVEPKPDPEPKPARITRQDHVRRLLMLAEFNIYQAWRDLGHVLNLDEDSQNWTLDYVLSETPGWKEAPPATRAQLLDVASRFLRELPAHFPDERWSHWATTGGFQAALLLHEAAPSRLDELSAADWVFWLPGFAEASGGQAEPIHLQSLVCRAYARYPTELCRAVPDLLRDQRMPYRVETLMRGFAPCWEDELTAAFDAALAIELPIVAWRLVLSTLLRRGDVGAGVRAVGALEGGAHDERAVAAARCLILDGDAETLAAAIPPLRADRALAVASILDAAPAADALPNSRWHLPAHLLADLYLLFADLFPPHEDPEPRPGVVRDVSLQDEVGQLRDRWLHSLVGAGTWDSLAELRRVIGEHPDLALPRMLLPGAEQEALRRAWRPLLQMRNVLEVVTDQQRRILRTSDQLLDLVLESLARLQAELIERDAVADLWSQWTTDGRWAYRPKRELLLADCVKRFLDRDLDRYAIVANREVENRSGNETDILVQYVDPRGGVRRLAVVLEVKGCWNDGLLTDIQDQLAERYLVEHEADRGAYVVFWFKCARWDRTDPQHGRPAGMEIGTLREELRRRAQALTSERRRVDAVVLDATWPWPDRPRDDSERPAAEPQRRRRRPPTP